MRKNLIAPALLALGFAGGALPATTLAQSQNPSSGNMGSQAPGSTYEGYLRQLHDELMREHASRQGGDGGGESQSQRQQSAQEQFMRGYRAGREEERRRRGSQSSQGSNRGSGSSQGSGQDRDRMFVIPNVYPDYVPFQQFALVPNYSRAMDHLLVAAQSLREAIQDLAQQPAGERRNRAIQEMQDALLETQQAMLRIPPDMR